MIPVRHLFYRYDMLPYDVTTEPERALVFCPYAMSQAIMWLRAAAFYVDVGLSRENLLTGSGEKSRQTYIHSKLWIESRENKTKLKHTHVTACALKQAKLTLSLSMGQR